MMNLTYEDCKELKDAGYVFTKADEDNCELGFGEKDGLMGIYYAYPSLSELIEACGDEILGLNRTHDDEGNPNGWVADTHTHECDCGKKDCFGFNWEHESGTTPEQAVKNLWITLNKK